MVRQVNFSRPAAAGTGQNSALVNALLKQALSPRQIRHPAQGFDQLGKAALAVFLQKKEAEKAEEKAAQRNEERQAVLAVGQGTPEQSIAPALADSTPGTELDPSGGFRVPGTPPDKQALARALAGSNFTDFQNTGLAQLFKEPKAPAFRPTRTIKRDGAVVTEELGEGGNVNVIGSSPQFQPREAPKPNLRTSIGGAVIDTDTDEVVTPGTLNVIDKDGKARTIPIRTKKELDNALDGLSNEEFVEGRVQRTREVTDIPGAVRILLPDLPEGMTPEQARLEGINIDLRPQTLEGLLESRGDTEQLDATFTELQQLIADTPGAVGTAGLIARVGNSIIAQLPLIATLSGGAFDPELLVVENYEETFRRAGVESQRGKSATLGAAYALALSQRRRGGRVAQQDIERALGQIGGTFGQDPGATIKILQDLKTRAASSYGIRAGSLLGQKPAPLDVTPSPVFSKQGATPKDVSVPEGHEFVRMQGGKVVVRDEAGNEFIQE